jgi:hypothetical protein
MNGNKLRITVKLAICIAVFLLPIGILLFSVVSISLAAINKDRNELKGITVLHSVMPLMRDTPQYIWHSVDNMADSSPVSMKDLTDLHSEFESRYDEHFDKEAAAVSPRAIVEKWYNISIIGTQQLFLRSYTD